MQIIMCGLRFIFSVILKKGLCILRYVSILTNANNHVRITFYIQRYTEEGFAVDAAVQQLVNQEFEEQKEVKKYLQ